MVRMPEPGHVHSVTEITPRNRVLWASYYAKAGRAGSRGTDTENQEGPVEISPVLLSSEVPPPGGALQHGPMR